MSFDTVSTELYTRAACPSGDPPHSELGVVDPSPEQARATIESNMLSVGPSGDNTVFPANSYSKARSSGALTFEEYERIVGRKLTRDEEMAIWDNKNEEMMVEMGR